jgi:hypothetical protein
VRERETIRVHPVEGGWLVSCRAVGEPTAFLSAERAEASAAALAMCLAGLGRDARVLIHDHADQTIAAQWFPARQRRRGDPGFAVAGAEQTKRAKGLSAAPHIS